MIVYRTITNLLSATGGLLAKVATYFHNEKTITSDVKILFQDGFYSLNSNCKVLILEDENREQYSQLYQDKEALEMINTHSLQDKDILIARNGTAFILRNKEGKFTIKNAETDLKTILTQDKDIDIDFLTNLETALNLSNFEQFHNMLKPLMEDYIQQKQENKLLIEKLLK